MGGVQLGDAISISGTIQSKRTLKVPDRLVEFLEFPVFQDIVVAIDTESEAEESGDRPTVHVITSKLPSGAKVGDRIEALGMVIEKSTNSDETAESDTVIAMVSLPLKWFPKTPTSDGWRLLGEAGVDVSELARVGTRNRKKLSAEDNEAFYQMLAVSQDIGGSPRAAQIEPKWIEPAQLLRAPQDFSGGWLRMHLQTVRVTYVAVTDPKRQKQLGSDHYYQVDAHGDLGNVVILIQRPEGEAGEPIRFEGTYPVSLVMKELPDFLSQAIRQQEGGDSAATMISRPVQVEAFFFRLWSYSSDFMERQGGGDQFGPLLMVARMTDRSRTGEDGIGVEIISYFAAFAVITGILATLAWSRWNQGEDDEVRERRKDREAETFQAPDSPSP